MAGIEKPLESCAVCHDSGSFASAEAAHAITGNATFTAPVFTVVGADLQVTYTLRIDGALATDYTVLSTFYRFESGVRTTLTGTTLSGGTGGNYTILIPGGAAQAATPNRYFFRVRNAALTNYAVVYADYPSAIRPEVVTAQACVNCHGPKFTTHHASSGYGNPNGIAQCAVCHDRSTTTLPSNLEMGHGIHNSHNMPSGQYVKGSRSWEITYPTYMTNCSVCHNTPAGLAAANAMTVTGDNCFSCHESMESWDFTVSGTVFHEAYDATTNCAACHDGTLAAGTVTGFHNGLLTGRSGVIWNGVDTSVVEGNKISMAITGIVDDGTSLAISWTASYDGAPVNPCNATIGATAPLFHNRTSPSSNFSMLRSYFQGDDPVIGMSTTAPGQALAVNLSNTNTTCSGNTATTTIPVDASRPAGSRGIVALQGKPALPNANPAVTTPMLVRALTPTREFVVGTGALPAQQRRAIAETADCMKCHVGSMYQHGGNRVDNVTMCAMCHNSASNEQNVRVGMGVEASEAYDGVAGQTYEFKTMLHAIHSAGRTGNKPYVVYRGNGIYAWAPSEDLLQNWPGTGTAIPVFGSADANGNPVLRNHNFHAPTYPRLLNDCGACHAPSFSTMVDQTRGMATTVNAGGTTWNNQLDDVLKGANSAACTSCHQDAASVGHANQNGWVPTVFPNGRQTIIDAAN